MFKAHFSSLWGIAMPAVHCARTTSQKACQSLQPEEFGHGYRYGISGLPGPACEFSFPGAFS